MVACDCQLGWLDVFVCCVYSGRQMQLDSLMGCTAKRRSPFNDCGKLCDWLDCFGAHFTRTAALSRVFSLELAAYLGFFIHRPFDGHQRCCFEIFNTLYKSLEALLVFPSLRAYPPPSPSSCKKLWKSNEKQKVSFNNFEASDWRTLQICCVIKTWRKLPPGPTHTRASVFTHMNALWGIVERHSELAPWREFLSFHSWSPEESSAT